MTAKIRDPASFPMNFEKSVPQKESCDLDFRVQ